MFYAFKGLSNKRSNSSLWMCVFIVLIPWRWTQTITFSQRLALSLPTTISNALCWLQSIKWPKRVRLWFGKHAIASLLFLPSNPISSRCSWQIIVYREWVMLVKNYPQHEVFVRALKNIVNWSVWFVKTVFIQ